ncbi:hypothetical protein BE04_14900 [Sorangium cellulosum]|uniref:CHAT domain-containing protein n=1 Tax=Sorangium cellulosum TaxID=56 RepID=A0A150PR83_SORCE|nr:hypothetical protein BE04_14900 [Sorangium cellulosum]
MLVLGGATRLCLEGGSLRRSRASEQPAHDRNSCAVPARGGNGTRGDTQVAHPLHRHRSVRFYAARMAAMTCPWMEIEIERMGADVRVAARGSRGETAASRMLGPGMNADRLCKFGEAAAEEAHRGRPLGPLAGEAQAIHRALMEGALDRLRSGLHGAARGAPVLVRFMVKSGTLQSVPWEALCEPDEAMGFWGISPNYLPVRGVMAEEPRRPWPVRRPLRVLAIAPQGGPSIDGLKSALEQRIKQGDVEWLPPIGPDQARLPYLFDRLSAEPRPHVIHFVGHGGVRGGKPVLQLATDLEDEPAWVPAELLGKQLKASTVGPLRLIVLEACEGAKPGDLASAAEMLSRCGADAVLAHLWPVQADIARLCSERFYAVLAGADREKRGNPAIALNEARRILLTCHRESAEAFSPVLYLRSSDPVLFEFTDVEPAWPPQPPPTPREIEKIVARPFSLVLGDRWRHDRSAIESFKEKLRAELATLPDPPPPDLPTSALMERAALEYGPGLLETKFQELFKSLPRPALLDTIARVLPPGVHITLLRTPFLEQAVEQAKPDTTIYVIQPGESRPGVRATRALPPVHNALRPIGGGQVVPDAGGGRAEPGGEAWVSRRLDRLLAFRRGAARAAHP